MEAHPFMVGNVQDCLTGKDGETVEIWTKHAPLYYSL